MRPLRIIGARDLFKTRRNLCDYEGGFVDGKIVNLAFLEDVAEKGNEPSHAAFEGAYVAYSHVPDIEAFTWFMTDREWCWMSGTIPVGD